MPESAWRPLTKPVRNVPVASAVATPFSRFARMHTLSAVGDGLVTLALAGSIFFSIDPSAARTRVALYLFLTIAPFAVVTPLIGPAIDRARGGRSTMILATTFGRAFVAFLMVKHIDSLLLFPEAFLMLVLQKAYVIANRAMVPKLVESEDQLVEANSKLALLSAMGSMGGAAFGAICAFVGGPAWSAAVAFAVFVASGILSMQLPRLAVTTGPADAEERRELRGSGILLASSAMAIMRGVVGFMTFLLAFEFRGGKEGVDIEPLGAAVGASTAIVRGFDITGDPAAPAWYFGVLVLGAGAGALIGARWAPQLRRRITEERLLLGLLVLTALAALVAMMMGGLMAAFLLSLAVAFSAAAGKLVFDSLVQRDAPDANYGRSFASFEARFQLMWVIGAFIPVVVKLNARLGYFLVLAAAGFAAVSYLIGVRAARDASFHTGPRGTRPDEDPVAAHGADQTATMVLSDGDPTRVFDLEGPDQVDPRPQGANEVPQAGVTAAESVESWGSGISEPVISAGDGVQIDRGPKGGSQT